MKITKYMLLEDKHSFDLVQKVDEHIKKGWQPLGGICVNTYGHNQYLHQAMVQYEQ